MFRRAKRLLQEFICLYVEGMRKSLQDDDSRLFSSIFESDQMGSLDLRMIRQHLLSPTLLLTEVSDSQANTNADCRTCFRLLRELRLRHAFSIGTSLPVNVSYETLCHEGGI